MKSKPAPTRVASKDEIDRAIEALTQEDAERLEQYAKNRIARIGPRSANRREHMDLFQEAITRMLDGPRHWYPEKVHFVPYLLGVIRSIASEWAGHRKRNADTPEYAVPETKLQKVDDKGNIISPFDDLKAQIPTGEELLIKEETESESKILADEIEHHFANDEDASYVLLGWEDGMDGPTIQKEFGFTETNYRATVRRIKRHAQKIAEQNYGQ